MENRSQVSSDLEDPLQGYSGLSLFPRTLKSLANTRPRPHESDDLQHVNNVVKSMPLRFQSGILEQAKVIVDSSSEFLNPTMPRNVTSDGENGNVEANPNANQRERRQGLGRKRARFSFKPTKNQPTASLEPSFDVDKYQNPEDFFSEFENFENAQREWQKQTGAVSIDADQNRRSIRARRPGIPGRKQVKYKHLYPSNAITEQTLEEEILSPSNHDIQGTTNTLVTSPIQDLSDSRNNKEKSVDDILGELLSCTQDELDGDGAVNLLEERLQIKPIDVGKLCLPEMQDVRRIDLKASRKSLLKPRPVFSDIQNMIKEIRSETSPKNNGTPLQLRSPLSSISLLLKQKSWLNSQSDQFSFFDANNLLAANVSNVSTSKMGIEDIAGPSEKSVNNSSTGHDSGFHASQGKPHSAAEANDEDNSVDESVRKRNSSRNQIDEDMPTVEPNHYDNRVEDMLQEATAVEQNDHIMKNPTLENLDDVAGQLAETLVEIESCKSAQAAQEQHNPENESSKSADGAREQNNGENGSTKSAQESEEQNNKKVHKSSRTRVNKQSKMISRESRAFSRRKSLAAAGTSWEAGLRRSTRIKSRPLEYWKGERFLYGRLHESLATVIGIKYASPAKGEGKATALKVKSFVSDEHKELVESAALH